MIMWTNSAIYQEDMDFITYTAGINWSKLRGKTVLVTGGTGLIGSTLINALLYANKKQSLELKVIALVRDLEKAKDKFAPQLQLSEGLEFVIGTVEALPKIIGNIDYIIHGASPTASLYFVEHPVETIKTAVNGTMALLQLARQKRVQGFVYLSSMEVYGTPQSDAIIEETQGTTVDTMVVRSCYPEAKRLCESLCASYASEYDVPAMVLRLAQTFGPGVAKNDARVFAEFARCVMQSQDIVLQTSGLSKRCYLYTADAVTAILTVLLDGVIGEAYNAANRETYCSIVEMAVLVAENLAGGAIKVRTFAEGKCKGRFPPQHKLNLGTAKLEGLGWSASKNLLAMYQRMIGLLRQEAAQPKRRDIEF